LTLANKNIKGIDIVLTLTKMNAVENMIMLENVHEDAVLNNLKRRYGKDQIYTYIGDVLISVNPFKNINNMYSEVSMNSFE
jgi:myosin heavy subunit